MTKEIYKSISGYKNYAVSNLGNVKNMRTGRILKQTINSHGYLVAMLYCDRKSKLLYTHRLVALTFLEKEEGKSVVDHKDGNKSNNTVANLRFCSSSQNSMNRKKKSPKSSSIYKGVTFHKPTKKWKVSIRVNTKLIHIGYFKTEIEAGKAYDVKAKELFGEFAKLNFKDEED